MKQADSDWLIARAQVGIALLFSIGFMGILFTLIFFYSNLSAPANTLLSGLTGALVTIVTQQSAFFFARNRPQALPDPTTTTTTTHTVTGPAPIIVPQGQEIVPAPPPPSAIVAETPNPAGPAVGQPVKP
jgi:hypothetical protein